MPREELIAALQQCIDANDSDHGMLYWQCSRGTALRGHQFPPASVKPNLMIFTVPCDLIPFTTTFRLISMEDTRFLHCNIKTLNLIPSVIAYQRCIEKDCQETVFHRGDRVTECAHSNILMIKDGVLCTPPRDNLILPGITLKHLLMLAEQNGIPTKEAPFTMKELEEAGLSIALCNIDGGLADNAIPRQAEAAFLVTGYKGNGEETDILERVMEKLGEGLATEYRKKDPGVRLQTEILDTEERMVLSEEDSRRLIDLICMLPYGVQAMSSSMKGLVETSLNPGVISLKRGQFHVGISVRSSVDSAKQGLFDRLSALAQLAGVEMEITGNYPGFAYKEDSPLCSKMSEVYESSKGERP